MCDSLFVVADVIVVEASSTKDTNVKVCNCVDLELNWILVSQPMICDQLLVFAYVFLHYSIPRHIT